MSQVISFVSQRGLDSTYYILEYGDWTIEKDTVDIYSVNETLQGKPKTVVFYKYGEIREEYFENQIGMQIGIDPIDEQEKQKIVEAYRKWKSKK